MNIVAATCYWVIVAIWFGVLGTVAGFYWRNPRAFGTTRLLLAVVAIDTLRNIIENCYFGSYFGSRYGLFPPVLASVLGNPVLLVLPKLCNVLAGLAVLCILLLHWLPAAVRERRLAEQTADSFRELAMYDGLTGLFNRRHFLAAAQVEWQRFHRYGRPLSLLMLDLDHFKSINDRYGHDAGDEVLVHVARTCRNGTRNGDEVARLGGEEFAILLPETTRQNAYLLAERLREAISARSLARPGGAIVVTVSIGVSAAARDATLAEFLKQGDLALYAAKASGRNRVCWFDPAAMPAGASTEFVQV